MLPSRIRFEVTYRVRRRHFEIAVEFTLKIEKM